MTVPITAILLAAGEGRRLARQKALIPFPDGRRSLGVLLDRLQKAGIHDAVVVTGCRAPEVEHLALARGARTIRNEQWQERGQTASLRLGISAVPTSSAGFLILPVDHLFVTTEDLIALRERFEAQEERTHAILRPTHRDGFGHPVLFGSAYLEEFRALPDDAPGHQVYRRHRDHVTLVPVTNEWIAQDVDTEEDLALLHDTLARATPFDSSRSDASLTETEATIVASQLGRAPAGALRVETRCPAGHPQVVRVHPLHDAGQGLTPFPTLFWLTCPELGRSLATLEANGWIRRLEERIAGSRSLREELARDHARYLSERWSLLDASQRRHAIERGFDDVLLTRGIGGIGDWTSLKCLHVHYAQHCADRNVVGAILEEELGIRPCGAP